jgi:hypothetical protein
MIRLYSGDRLKAAVNENVGQGDGSNRYFMFDMFPLVSSPTANVVVFLTGVTAATNTYTISGNVGRLTFAGANTPAAGATILVNYEYYTLSSGEITDILSGYAGKPMLAAANAVLIIAADNARLFNYTMGDKKVDRSDVVKNLLELSRSLEKRYYKQVSTDNYDTTIATMPDDTGLPYHGFDTAVAYLGNDANDDVII